MLEYRNKGQWSDVQVHLTNNCTHLCLHCYTGSSAAEKGWLPFSHFESILDFVAGRQGTVLRLLGGEIITRQMQASPYLDMCRKRGIRPIISTNGYHSECWEDGLVDPSSVQEVIISCYGNEAEHDAVTMIPGSYRKTRRTLAFLASRPARSFEITVNTQLTTLNSDSFEAFLIDLARIGVDEVKTLVLSPLGFAHDNVRQGFVKLRPAVAAFTTVEERLRESVDRGKFGAMRLVMERAYAPEGTMPRKTIPRCRLHLATMVTVDSKGNVYPCHLMIHQPGFVIGSLATQGLASVLSNYEKNGGGIAAEAHWLQQFGSCPAYAGSKVYRGAGDIVDAHVCPMHLELVEGTSA